MVIFVQLVPKIATLEFSRNICIPKSKDSYFCFLGSIYLVTKIAASALSSAPLEFPSPTDFGHLHTGCPNKF